MCRFVCLLVRYIVLFFGIALVRFFRRCWSWLNNFIKLVSLIDKYAQFARVRICAKI